LLDVITAVMLLAAVTRAISPLLNSIDTPVPALTAALKMRVTSVSVKRARPFDMLLTRDDPLVALVSRSQIAQ